MPATQDNEYRCQLRGSDDKKKQGHSREIGAQGKNLKIRWEGCDDQSKTIAVNV